MNQNPGALERPKDERDIMLGSIQAPVTLPDVYIPDMSWLLPVRNYQGQTPTCGAHAVSHFKMIMDYLANQTVVPRYTPRFSWMETKLLDNLPPEDGTDMRSIFKAIQNNGMLDFELMGNDVTLPLATYTDPANITPEMVENAAPKSIGAYAFDNTDIESIKQAIYKNKAVILLIVCDDGFWGTQTPTFTNPKYGHFVVAYGWGYNGIMIIDSSDEIYGLKTIANAYVTPTFVLESGTAVNIPPSVVKALTSGQIALAQQILFDMKLILEKDLDILKQRSGI